MASIMSNLQGIDDLQRNVPVTGLESELRLPLDSSIRMIFSGYFNGFGVEVRSIEEIALLYHMGCFGKGSTSRSKPQVVRNAAPGPVIMRQRQYAKRSFWYKKFAGSSEKETDDFIKDVAELVSKIKKNKNGEARDVIDLVSSDEDSCEVIVEENLNASLNNDDDDIVVVVPNSDSEDENYFEKFVPKCCVNKTVVQEKLILTLEEAFFLMYGLGCLQLWDTDNKLLNFQEAWQMFLTTNSDFTSRYVVYHYFRSKGYVVKPGIQFGGDYLLYRDGPSVSHSDYIVVIKDEKGDVPANWTQILGHIRMASTTVKEVLIAEVVKNSDNINQMPNDLSNYSVREIILTRNTPMQINNDLE